MNHLKLLSSTLVVTLLTACGGSSGNSGASPSCSETGNFNCHFAVTSAIGVKVKKIESSTQLSTTCTVEGETKAVSFKATHKVDDKFATSHYDGKIADKSISCDLKFESTYLPRTFSSMDSEKPRLYDVVAGGFNYANSASDYFRPISGQCPEIFQKWDVNNMCSSITYTVKASLEDASGGKHEVSTTIQR